MSDIDIDLRHLRSVVAVARHLNFSRAAETLHVTQQSLSAQIQQLERRLGVRLFERTTRQVALTAAGEVMVEQATAILNDVTTALERVRRAAVGDLGHLSLSFTPTIAYETLPALMAEVDAQSPDLTLRVSEMWQAESVEAVRSGRLDAGLARHPQLTDDLDSVIIRYEPLGAVVGVAHPLSQNATIAPAELTDCALVVWPRDFSPAFFDEVVGSLFSHGYRGDIVEMHLLTRGSFLQDPASHRAIQAGEAFAVAFAHQHDPLPEGFVWKPLEPAPLIAVHLYWRRPATVAIERLVDIATKMAHSHGWR